ncbi:hypothetical protein A4G26_02475 [Mycobacterium kansasii]|nr:hypothetical protein A4G26_02475 [Mycobacterium kansasii]
MRPQEYTRSLFGLASLMDAKGISALKPQPNLTRRVPSWMRTSLRLGPQPSGTEKGRNQRS